MKCFKENKNSEINTILKSLEFLMEMNENQWHRYILNILCFPRELRKELTNLVKPWIIKHAFLAQNDL